MRCRIVHCLVRVTLLCACPGFLMDVFAEEVVPSNAAIKAAVTKSLPLLETATRGSMEKRKQCFTCHNQALPVMALTTARSRGITIDAENLQHQVRFTAELNCRAVSFTLRKSNLPVPSNGKLSTRKNASVLGFHKFGKSFCASLSRHSFNGASASLCNTTSRSPFFSSGTPVTTNVCSVTPASS